MNRKFVGLFGLGALAFALSAVGGGDAKAGLFGRLFGGGHDCGYAACGHWGGGCGGCGWEDDVDDDDFGGGCGHWGGGCGGCGWSGGCGWNGGCGHWSGGCGCPPVCGSVCGPVYSAPVHYAPAATCCAPAPTCCAPAPSCAGGYGGGYAVPGGAAPPGPPPEAPEAPPEESPDAPRNEA